MRKRTVLLIFEKLMWFIVLMIPLLAYLCKPFGYTIGGGTAISTSGLALPQFASVMNEFGINSDNIVYQCLEELFGYNGIIHFFKQDSAIMLYFAYFIMVEIVHLFVDFILFIPRYAHKWMSFLTDEKNEG